MEDLSILEPVKLYNSTLKNQFKENAIKYFDELLKESKVDENENVRLVKEYNKYKIALEKTNKEILKNNVLKTFMILFIIFGAISLIVGIIGLAIDLFEMYVSLILLFGGVGLIIVGAVVLAVVVKSKASKLEAKRNKLQAKITEQFDLLSKQIQPLLKLFDYNIPAKIIRKTTPLIQVDDYFDIEKFTYLNEKYNFGNITDKHTSTHFVLSGSIIGNPFLFVRNLNESMGSKVYTGSIVIHWTETVSDSKGRTHLVTRTQTLTASVSKPYPYYSYNTYLVYGNDAAPKLTFSRNPSGTLGKNEKAIKKLVKDRIENLKDKAEKAVSEGKNFTMMSNEEFEALFNAENRNNEVEFRLLFTPLAQKNYVELLKSQKPFGDDFVFEKKKCLNFIVSNHTQKNDVYAYPERFYGYDVKVMRDNFVNYLCNYFEGFYFDMVPILSIPLYQQQKSREYIYEKKFKQNYTNYEDEVMANRLGWQNFRPDESATDVILKTSYLSSDKNTDKIKVCAYSYKAIPRVDYVYVFGGDGRNHAVPVPWNEYIEVKKDSLIGVKKISSDKPSMDSVSDKIYEYFSKYNKKGVHHFERGLLAFLLDQDYTNSGDDELNDFFNSLLAKKEEN